MQHQKSLGVKHACAGPHTTCSIPALQYFQNSVLKRGTLPSDAKTRMEILSLEADPRSCTETRKDREVHSVTQATENGVLRNGAFISQEETILGMLCCTDVLNSRFACVRVSYVVPRFLPCSQGPSTVFCPTEHAALLDSRLIGFVDKIERSKHFTSITAVVPNSLYDG